MELIEVGIFHCFQDNYFSYKYKVGIFEFFPRLFFHINIKLKHKQYQGI